MKRTLKSLPVFALVAVLVLCFSLPVSAQKTTVITDPTRHIVSENLSVFGDANLDEKVNIKDATDIQKVIANIKQSDDISELLADVNEDNYINIKDATEIQKWLAKLSINIKIGMPLETGTEASTSTQPVSTTDAFSAETKNTGSTLIPSAAVDNSSVSETSVQTDPVESDTAPATASSDVPQETTEATETFAETDPTEDTQPKETLPTASADEEEPEDLYRKAVMDKFVEKGYNPYEDGMFYEVIYCYYGENTTYRMAPEYVLIWASIGMVADEYFEITIGDYVLKCSGRCYPYDLGYFIYNPSSDSLLTIEEAYRYNLYGLETVFKEAPVFRTIKVDFNIIEELRINYYGSEKTELFLLHHSSAEEELKSKFTEGFFDIPELNLPKDENGFYYDKIYLVSLNVVGGTGASQWIHKITVENGILTVYRTITQPMFQPPDMNYQYVLIELDASLAESISELKDISVIA